MKVTQGAGRVERFEDSSQTCRLIGAHPVWGLVSEDDRRRPAAQLGMPRRRVSAFLYTVYIICKYVRDRKSVV